MDTLEKHVLLSDARLEKEKQYWLRQFSDFTEMTRMAFTSSPSAEGRIEVKHYVFHDSLSQRLNTVSRGSDHALFILLLAGLSYVLHRYTGEAAITVGVPVMPDTADNSKSLNPLVLIRANIQPGDRGREFIAHIKQRMVEADQHSNFPFSLLLDLLGVDLGEGPHCSMIAGMEGLYDPAAVEEIGYDCRFEFQRRSDHLVLQVKYHATSYAEWFVSQFFMHYEKVLEHLLFHPDNEMDACNLLGEEELKQFVPSALSANVEKVASIPALFEEQVALHPDKVAVTAETGVYTYKELNDMANRVASYLHRERQLKHEEPVGIMMHNSVYSIIGMLAVLKAGGTYIPLDPEFPHARMKKMMEDACIGTVLSLRPHLRQLNRLQWELPQFAAYICLDTDQLEEAEELENEFMDQNVWNFVADQATDEISGGAWVSSYTRQDLSPEEMDEYADNIRQKLLPYLNPTTRVLEIGCASGISMFTLAPHVGFYYGTDLSSSMIRNCQERVEREGFRHIKLDCLPADQINRLNEGPFDIIILNSVVQVFKGHHYLRKVLRSALEMLSERGILFIGDVMDLDSKEAFLQDLRDYDATHPEVSTKTEFDNELFLSRAFFRDLQAEYRAIGGVHFSDKIYTIPNELTLYRYDVIIEVDQAGSEAERMPGKLKHQHDLKWIQRQGSDCPDVNVSSHQAAYILYTSGSTGTPKGVVIEHQNVVRLLQTTSSLFAFGSRDVWSLFHSTSFDFSVWEIFGALLYGGQLVIVPRDITADTRSFVRLVQEQRISILSQTPSAFYQFAREAVQSRVDLPALNMVVFGGEALQPAMLKEWNEQYPGVRLINMYGITETTVHVTYKELTAEDINRNRSDIGRSLPSYQVYVLDPWQRIVPAGVPGELYVGGSGVAREYLHLDALTRQRFISIPIAHSGRVYRSGDMARWNPDGSLEYMGRIDEQVKIRGYRMETGEITAVLLDHPSVDQAVVHLIRAEDGSKELCVYYVAAKELNAKELREFIGTKLPRFMVPSYVVQLDSMPLTPNGKVDRRKLPDPRQGFYKDQTFTMPEGPLEQELAHIFEDILGIEQVGRHDSFFEMGGHSLKATRLVSRIYKHFECELNLRDIFRFPSVHELALHIQGHHFTRPFEKIRRAPDRAFYPLTSAQKRVFILEQFSDIGTSYNMPVVLRVQGPLDPERVKDCYIHLLKRHSSLRTAFHMNGDEPVQTVLDMDSLSPGITFLDMPDASEKTVHERIDEFIRPFDLNHPPLVRITVIRIQPEQYLFMLDMHHIISDGTSLNIWIHEFMSLYQGDALEPLEIQYIDYAVWQHEQQALAVMENQRTYWHEQLAGELPVLQLPYDEPRPSIQDFRGNQFTIRLGHRLTGKLGESCRDHGVTLYMLLLAAYQVLLHRYTGQEDIIVGTPVAGRGHADLEPVIGMFVNTLAIRCRPRSDQTFGSFLQEVKNTSLEAFEHADYPFEELVQELQVTRDSSRNPMFDTMFALQNMERTVLRIADLQIEAYDYEWRSAKFDLLLQAEQEPGDLVLTFEYATSLFRQSTIERMSASLMRILEEAILNPDLHIGELEIMTGLEKTRLNRQLAGEQLDFTVADNVCLGFEEQVMRTPDRTAIRDERGILSYRELNARANQLARMLQAKGIVPRTAVAICGERSISYITGVLAILKAGGTFVPIDAAFPQERIIHMVEDSGARLLINCTGQPVHLPETPTLHLDYATLAGDPVNLGIPVTANEAIYTIYTSGTTGTPKGVQLSQRNFMNLVLHHRKQSGIRMNGKVLHSSSIGFDVCYQEMLVTLLSGGELVIASDNVKKTPDLLLDLLGQQEVKTIFLPTAYFNFLIAEEDYIGRLLDGSLEHIVVAGEALVLTPPFMNAYSQSSVQLHNHYGPSETHVVTTLLLDKHSQLRERPSVGRPINNIECYILDKNQRIVPAGVTGELYITGASVGLGYWNQAGLTAAKFLPNPFKQGTVMYRTGDLARLLSSGEIELMGRADQQVKIRGYRIEPGEITAVMLQHGRISQAATTVRVRQDGTRELYAFYTSGDGIEALEVQNYLARRLPSYMVPPYLIRIEVMPYTPNGKVDYRALAEISPADLPRTPGLLHLPETELEQRIGQMYRSILEKDEIGRDFDFFEHGGHSLKAMRLVAKIRKELNAAVTLRDIFLNPTVQTLAEHVSHMDTPADIPSIAPAQSVQKYPLSSAQKRLYILDQYEGISTAYHLSSALLVEGMLDLERVQKVYNALLERHESLRTTFHMEGDEPIQVVAEPSPSELWFRDAREMEEAAVHRLADSFIRPFHLREAPLLRLGIIQLGNSKHLLLMDMHHIISDGTSIGILVQDFIDLYREVELPPVPVAYKDFAVWQQQQLQSDEIARKETFWMNHLSGELPVLQFPTDFPRPAQQRFEGDLTSMNLGQDLLLPLRSLAQRTGTTLYMIMLSAFQVLLHNYSGEEDLIVGVPVAGRTHEDVAGVVGMFVNTLPFRSRPERSKPFAQYLQEVKDGLLEAFEHQDYPLERMIDMLDLPPDPSRNPLFAATFDMQNMSVPEFHLDGMTISGWDSSHASSKFDFSVSLAEQEDYIRCTVEYATSLFRKETVDRMMNQYRVLLQSIVSSAEATIGELNMVPEDEAALILNVFNPALPAVGTYEWIHNAFERMAEVRPEAVAAVWKGQILRYGELNGYANELAYTLLAQEVGANDVVAIYMDKSLDTLISILAILKAGAAYLPIDPEYPADRVQFMLDSSGSKCVIADAQYGLMVEKTPVLIYSHSDRSPAAAAAAGNLNTTVHPDHPAYVIYTSGSTGQPKGVMVPHRGLSHLAALYKKELSITSDDRITQIASIAFDLAAFEIFAALTTGAELHLVPRSTSADPVALTDFLNSSGITFVAMTPSHLAHLNPEDLRTIRMVASGGEAISVYEYERWSRFGYANLYGPTEATILTTLWKPDSARPVPANIPIGKPVAHSRIYILNETGRLQPLGVEGEICITGEGLAKGYLGLPEATREKFVDNPFEFGTMMYKTGDRGRWLPDGNMEYTGRMDNQVKVRGYRIETGEIELALLLHQAIREAAVIVKTNAQQERFLCAFVVEAVPVSSSELKSFLSSSLPVYMVPSFFVRLEQMPVTVNGKLDIKKLERMDTSLFEEIAYVPPQTDLQVKLIAIWEKHLKTEGVGIRHNFFELGGQSLKAARLISDITQELGVTLSLKHLYQYQTIEELTLFMEGGEQHGSSHS
ncbi:amino acid adenylation domain-containing protein [Paenibacillus sp. P96]|uniref:Amino acid adenylation domain-containing protein n=1 Tax=Paenibacillus zeirhizosphaerae TaxID=2987519 RepID=A0ABT9FVU0_9BACL|nr:non-ribosomal peptide synthetase [Paenibacillus sp. P96]MDP4098851.1 amino acid adenylation domain-containing protein [Paenibacillus sp. P96]